VFKPVMIYNFLQAARLIGDACVSFNDHCAVGIEAIERNISAHRENSLMLVTALNTHIGYENAAKIAKKAHHEGTSLREAALTLGLVTDEQFSEWVDARKMSLFDNNSAYTSLCSVDAHPGNVNSGAEIFNIHILPELSG
jgi:fumarate hydratase class II